MFGSKARAHNHSNAFFLFMINKIISETVISVPTGPHFHNKILCHGGMYGNMYAGWSSKDHIYNFSFCSSVPLKNTYMFGPWI